MAFLTLSSSMAVFMPGLVSPDSFMATLRTYSMQRTPFVG